MPEDKQKTWVKSMAGDMDELIREAIDERQQWSDDAEEAFGWYNCDREEIFTAALDKDSRNDPDAASQYHMPLVRQHTDSLVASTTHNDIKINYIPKIDQQGVDDIARMGNALFDSYRTHIRWDSKVHVGALQAALFGCTFFNLYVDRFHDFPEPRVDFRVLNPWQVFSTPGIPFEEAGEVVTQCWIDKDELRAQYPEFADEIDILKPSSEGDTKTDERDGSDTPTNRIQWTNTPGYNGQESVVSKNAVMVRERWKFDPSLKTVSYDADQKVILQEHAIFEQAIAAGDQSMLPQDGALLYDEYQYHGPHNVEHLIYISELRERAAETTMVQAQDYYGIVTTMEETVLDSAQIAVVDVAIEILNAHVEVHDEALEDLEDWEIGKKPKYSSGWRQTIIIGETTKLVGVYDGDSQFKQFGMDGIPIVKFMLQPSALDFWTGSYASMLVDHNKLLNQFLNTARDNMKIFGNHQWWETIEHNKDESTRISTNPEKPTILRQNAITAGEAGIIPAMGVPDYLPEMMGLILSMAQQQSGIFGSIRGERQSGVRSGQHEQFLAQSNRAQLDSYHRMWKNSLEAFCTKLFKLMIAIPPDDRFVKPMIDGQYVDVNIELLEDIEYIIEVIMTPGGTSSTEERQSMLLGFTQNMVAHPLIQADPQGLVLMFKFMAESVKLQMPDMSQAMMQYANELEQRAQDPQVQGAMQAQQAPPQGGQRTPQ